MNAPLPEWAAIQERGSPFWTRLGLFLVQRLGWRFGRAMLLPITAWFLVSSPKARSASREYLGHALGRPAQLSDIARHIHAFACSILDAPFFLARRTQNFTVEVTGLDHLEKLLSSGRGCILLGGHLGGFEVLRHVGQGSPVPVRPLMYRRNSGVLTALLASLDPSLARAVIPLGEPDSMLQAREAIERGEIIGILADRASAGEREVVVPFLGRDAAFPAGPFIVAAILGAPVLSFRGVCTGPRRYEVRFEPFADRIILRREQRAEDLYDVAHRFARLLGQGCLAHPYQWFNFFSFWKAMPYADDAAPALHPGRAPAQPGP